VKLLAGYQIRMKTNNETKFKRVGVFVEVVLASSYQDTAIELGNELVCINDNDLPSY
jgi:hypothetical protein